MKIIYKTFLGFIIASFALLIFFIPIKASSEPLNIYLFYGEGCPHCEKEKEFLSEVESKYLDQVDIKEFEIYYNQSNSDLFLKVIESHNQSVAGVPYLVIGDKPLVGFADSKTTGQEILERIEYCIVNICSDNIATFFEVDNPEITTVNIDEPSTSSTPVINPTEIEELENEGIANENSPILLNTYIFGDVNLKDVSLPVATILIAFVDGFNPCAMWVLVFLITMLINMRDKKRLYILGSIFILTSGLVYFVFLSAWFNFFRLIGYVYWIKVAIGLLAIYSGISHIKSALFSKGGCHATNQSKRESIMSKIKTSISRRSLVLSILGIMILAISVNLIEVVCSAGLPAIYTNLLSSISLSGIEYFGYLSLYALVFMIDDLLIFFIAVKTFEVTGVAKKYTKVSNLVGGVIILIIGIILILKPELLMFG